MTEYSRAAEAEPIADRLIKDHHPHLDRVKVEFVWRDTAATRNGQTVLGKAKKISGLGAYLAGSIEPFFVIELAADEWKDLDADQRKALVDHELSHCGVDLDGKATIRGHDCEEFAAIVRRHGLWKGDLKAFGEAVQLTLDPPPDESFPHGPPK